MGQILLEQVTPNHTQDMKEFAINERVMARHNKESGTATAIWEESDTKRVKVRVHFDSKRCDVYSPLELTPEIVYVTQETIDEGGDYEALLGDKNYIVVENL